MKAFFGSWVLTTEYSTKGMGQPVLVHRATGKAYGPADFVTPYATWRRMPAAAAVRRMVEMAAYVDADGQAAAEKFCGLAEATAQATHRDSHPRQS